MSDDDDAKPKREKLVNFYRLPKVQKYLPQHDDKQKKLTGMPLQQHILACGSTGSGKSQALLNYIYLSGQASKDGTFSKVYLVYKTYEPLYRFIEEELKEKLVMCEGLENLPDIKTFPDSSETNKKQILIVFDDVVNDKDTKSLKKLQPYYTYGRKKGLTNFFLSQSFFQTDIFIRKQTSWVLLCGITGRSDLRAILRNYSIGDVELAVMERMYQHAKRRDEDEDVSFLKVCAYECPMNKKFSRNFLEYLRPSDFVRAADKTGGSVAAAAPAEAPAQAEEADEGVYVSLADILG